MLLSWRGSSPSSPRWAVCLLHATCLWCGTCRNSTAEAHASPSAREYARGPKPASRSADDSSALALAAAAFTGAACCMRRPHASRCSNGSLHTVADHCSTVRLKVQHAVLCLCSRHQQLACAATQPRTAAGAAAALGIQQHLHCAHRHSALCEG